MGARRISVRLSITLLIAVVGLLAVPASSVASEGNDYLFGYFTYTYLGGFPPHEIPITVFINASVVDGRSRGLFSYYSEGVPVGDKGRVCMWVDGSAAGGVIGFPIGSKHFAVLRFVAKDNRGTGQPDQFDSWVMWGYLYKFPRACSESDYPYSAPHTDVASGDISIQDG
jgi:hypothetical protein